MLREFNANVSEISSSKISMLRGVIFDSKEEMFGDLTKQIKDEIYEGLSIKSKEKIKKRKATRRFKIIKSIKLNNESREEMLLEMQDIALESNIGKEELLLNFVSTYMADLSVFELDSLKIKLEYYISLFPILDLKSPESKSNEKLVNMCEQWKSQNMLELIYQLIINNIILPEIKNQETFNFELKAVLARLDFSTINKILNSSINSPVIFRSIDAAEIYTQMEERGVYACSGNKELKGEALTNFSINMTLDSIGNYATEDRIAFDFVFRMSEGTGIDRNTIEAYFTEKKYPQIGANSYMIGLNEDLNLFATLSDLYISGPVSPDDFDEQRCQISIWTKPRVSNMTSEEYLAKTMSTAPIMVEKFLSGFYLENKDLFGDKDTFKKSIIDVTSLVRFGGIGDENELDDETVKLGGTTKTSNVLGEIDINKMELKTLIMDEDTSDAIDQFVDNINNLENYKKYNISLPKGALFYGEGGGGKTTICRNIAVNTKIQKKKFFKINIHELLNSYLGNSEKHAKAIFDMARKYRDEGYLVYLFIDEVDGLMADKEGTEAISGTRSVILQELDGIGSDNEGIIILATTNYIGKLSSSFKRRFETKVEVKAPDKETLKKLFDLYIEKHFAGLENNLDIDKLVSNKVIGKTSGFVEAWVRLTAAYFEFKKIKVLDNDVFDKTFKRAEFEMSEEKGRPMGFGQ